MLTKMLDYFAQTKKPEGCKEKDVERAYKQKRPSIADKFSVVDFSDKHNVFLLEDGLSIGSGFEIGDIAADGVNEYALQSVFQRVMDVFSYVLPLEDENPWVLQVYVNDEFSLESTFDFYKQSIDKQFVDNEYTKTYLKQLKRLYEKATDEDGLFFDSMSDMVYRGRLRRIRMVFFKRYTNKKDLPNRASILREHLTIRRRILKKFQNAGIDIDVLKGTHFYSWWVRWFNPNPKLGLGSTDKLLKDYPYPENQKPANFSFSQNVFYNHPKTDCKNIYFDDKPHRVLFFDSLSKLPEIGCVSREIEDPGSKKKAALLDKLPEGTVYSIQVVFSSNESVSKHLKMVEKGTLGGSLEAQTIRNDLKDARNAQTLGNRLFWVSQCVYIQGKENEDLDAIEESLIDLFSSEASMPLMPSKYDVHPIDSYLSMFPFNFNFSYFHKHIRFDKLMFASEVAALMPVYGRHKGAKHMPCFPYFNRVGEPFFFDPLHKDFATKNSHMAIFADSGGGKSVMTGHKVNSLMATKNARIVLFEMGNSFGGLIKHAKKKGKKVSQLVFSNDPKKAIAINPFANWYKAIAEVEAYSLVKVSEEHHKKVSDLFKSKNQSANDAEKACDERRCYLTEMALALRTMITQASAKEEDAFSLSDETLLIEVLSDAILNSVHDGVDQMLTEHVVASFKRRLDGMETSPKKDRIQEMHDRLKSYVIGPKARFFNVPTKPLDDFDIFHIDVLSLKDDKAKLALVMISLLPRILAIAEENEASNRPMYLFVDEAHLQLDIDVLVAYFTLIAKVARKIGLWLVLITQNVSDLKSEKAKKILSLCETWIVLSLSENEIENIKEFKPITKEQESLIRSLRTQKGLYSEAMLINTNYQGIFRVIPPRELLALLLNNTEEKQLRSKLEVEYGYDKAIEIMAQNLYDNKADNIHSAVFHGD